MTRVIDYDSMTPRVMHHCLAIPLIVVLWTDEWCRNLSEAYLILAPISLWIGRPTQTHF